MRRKFTLRVGQDYPTKELAVMEAVNYSDTGAFTRMSAEFENPARYGVVVDVRGVKAVENSRGYWELEMEMMLTGHRESIDAWKRDVIVAQRRKRPAEQL